MSNDISLHNGCQKKWKLIILLLLSAAVAMTAAWMVENQFDFQAWLLLLQAKNAEEGTWIDYPCDPDDSLVLADEHLFIADGHRIYVTNLSGQRNYELQMDSDAILVSAGRNVMAYEPNHKTVYRLTDSFWERFDLKNNVQQLSVSLDGRFAVISSCSGFLTDTLFYDADGTLCGEVRLREAAMTKIAYHDTSASALQIDKNGNWYLCGYALDGSMSYQVPLDCFVCYDLSFCGDNIIVQTDSALLFFDSSGNLMSQRALSGPQKISVGENALAVIENDRLVVLTPDGTKCGEIDLNTPVRDVIADRNAVYILTEQFFYMFNVKCECLNRFSCGARASQIVAGDQRCVLSGDGEIMQITFS